MFTGIVEESGSVDKHSVANGHRALETGQFRAKMGGGGAVLSEGRVLAVNGLL